MKKRPNLSSLMATGFVAAGLTSVLLSVTDARAQSWILTPDLQQCHTCSPQRIG